MVLYRSQSLHCSPALQFVCVNLVSGSADITMLVCMWRTVYTDMKEKSLRFRMSERRYNKLKLYAASKEKTMTQLIEDWVDRLPTSEIANYSDTHKGCTS
ncbi:CopG domain protein DNA-binding domain protein [Scytonema sp. HK-05]|nr:CopG domain protein DNA-binding domain protein [Scytonema sp. HK-05]BAY48103.1 CopG domain protein DNA-binding domain protein [Scytonema sp. HK-05]